MGINDNDEEWDSGSGDRVQRPIKGVTRRDRLRNENIRADVKDILQYIEETHLRWFGQENANQQNSTGMAIMETKQFTSSRTST